MRLPLFIGAVVVAFCSAAAAASADLNKVQAQRQIQRTIVAPTVRINDDCSGQVVYSKYDIARQRATTYILTAKHCTTKTEGDEYFVIDIPIYDKGNVLIGERVVFAKVKDKDATSDLALLELTDYQNIFPRISIMESQGTNLYIGEDCWASGYALGKSIMVTKGLVGPMERANVGGLGYTDYLRATAQIAGGNSGGGLYHQSLDGSYKMIGVATAAIPSSGFIALWTPLSKIAPFLAKNLPGGKD